MKTDPNSLINWVEGCHLSGLTKREYFAGLAMQGLCAKLGNDCTQGFVSFEAVAQADSLIAELNKGQEK